MSIRLRLTLWYTAILFVALAAFAGVLGQQIAQTRYKDLDATLSSRAREVAAQVKERFRTQNVIFATIPEPDNFTEDDVSIQIVDVNRGVVRASSNFDPGLVLGADDLAAIRAGYGGPRTVQTVSGRELRVYLLPVLLTNDGMVNVAVVSAKPRAPLVAGVNQALIGLAAGTLGISLMLALIVYAVAKNALRPITQMARDAAGIQKAQDLAGRVAVPKTGDEVAALGRTINEMLGRLETAFEAQRRFIADASHELRTPLTAIRGNADILRQHTDRMPVAERAEMLNEVSAEAERMSRLVHDLLTLARAQAGEQVEPRPLRLDAVLDGTVRTARRLAQGHEIAYTPATAPMWVRGDADRLKQVLLILLDNAVKYTPPEGHIWVWVWPAGEQIEVRVADDGPGIPADQLPHLFERFYRGGTPARGRDDGGAGLGLAIAREIVQTFGGTIGVESSVGHGTAFIVRLPRADPPAADSDMAETWLAEPAEAVAAR